jgi:hypothetical protein
MKGLAAYNRSGFDFFVVHNGRSDKNQNRSDGRVLAASLPVEIVTKPA